MPHLLLNLSFLSLFSFLSFFTLSACSSTPKIEIDCPPIAVEKATAEAVFFKNSESKAVINRTLTAKLLGYKGSCETNKDNNTMTLTLNPEFELTLGTAAEIRKQSFSYFVAIPSLYPSREAKQIFTVNVDFPKGFDTLTYRDEPVNIIIPLKADKDINDYKIYIGLQLTEEQLIYNRSLHKYR